MLDTKYLIYFYMLLKKFKMYAVSLIYSRRLKAFVLKKLKDY